MRYDHDATSRDRDVKTQHEIIIDAPREAVWDAFATGADAAVIDEITEQRRPDFLAGSAVPKLIDYKGPALRNRDFSPTPSVRVGKLRKPLLIRWTESFPEPKPL